MTVRARVVSWTERTDAVGSFVAKATAAARRAQIQARRAGELSDDELRAMISSAFGAGAVRERGSGAVAVLIEGAEDADAIARAAERTGVAVRTAEHAAMVLTTSRYDDDFMIALSIAAPASFDAVKRALDGWFGPVRDLSARGTTLALSKRTHYMGIVNVTPDSFSDGGRYIDPDVAIKHGMRLAEEGADILDVGGESTRPGADPVGTDEELRRVVPVIAGLVAQTDVPVSIDTMKASVARAALDAGASIVNDVSAGRFDAEMLPAVAEAGVPYVLMHMRGEPRTMQADTAYADVVGEVYAFCAERAEAAIAAGIAGTAIVVDPGFGFGKTVAHNLVLLRRLREFRCLGFPILAGTSRKSFIGAALDLPVDERVEGTAATVAVAVTNGVSILRVHDVGTMRRVGSMVEAIGQAAEPGLPGGAGTHGR